MLKNIILQSQKTKKLCQYKNCNNKHLWFKEFCSEHTFCKLSGCTNMCIIKDNYCDIHKCKQCNNKKLKDCIFCVEHSCMFKDCQNIAVKTISCKTTSQDKRFARHYNGTLCIQHKDDTCNFILFKNCMILKYKEIGSVNICYACICNICKTREKDNKCYIHYDGKIFPTFYCKSCFTTKKKMCIHQDCNKLTITNDSMFICNEHMCASENCNKLQCEFSKYCSEHKCKNQYCINSRNCNIHSVESSLV